MKKTADTTYQKGQALVETLISTVFLTMICFAALQLCIIVLNDLLVNEAAFSSVRAAAVARTGNDESKILNQKTLLTALAILGPHIHPNNLLPFRAKTQKAAVSSVTIYETTIEYLVHTMFTSFIDPGSNRSFSIGKSKFLKRFSRARMVKSPDEEYYDKAYPGAQKFGY